MSTSPQIETTPKPAAVEPFDINETLAKLRGAYAAALGNDDEKLLDWYALIDEFAEPLFDHIAQQDGHLLEMKNGLEKAAAIILASDRDKLHLNERLLAEIHRNENLKLHHAEKVRQMNEEMNELRAANQAWKGLEERMKKTALSAIAEIKRKHDNAALAIVSELNRRGMGDLVPMVAAVT